MNPAHSNRVYDVFDLLLRARCAFSSAPPTPAPAPSHTHPEQNRGVRDKVGLPVQSELGEADVTAVVANRQLSSQNREPDAGGRITPETVGRRL